MNKICTSIEQSKKLIELGIDVNTADMYWWYSGKRYYIEAMDDGDFNKESDVPAWSLSALLSVLPNKLQIALAINDFQGDIKERYAIGSVNSDIYNCYADNPVDACYEMIIRLHSNQLL